MIILSQFVPMTDSFLFHKDIWNIVNIQNIHWSPINNFALKLLIPGKHNFDSTTKISHENHRTEDGTYLSISETVQHSNQESLKGYTLWLMWI